MATLTKDEISAMLADAFRAGFYAGWGEGADEAQRATSAATSGRTAASHFADWLAEQQRLATPQFENVSCSQCGRDFGPGDAGYSHCDQHK